MSKLHQGSFPWPLTSCLIHKSFAQKNNKTHRAILGLVFALSNLVLIRVKESSPATGISRFFSSPATPFLASLLTFMQGNQSRQKQQPPQQHYSAGLKTGQFKLHCSLSGLRQYFIPSLLPALVSTMCSQAPPFFFLLLLLIVIWHLCCIDVSFRCLQKKMSGGKIFPPSAFLFCSSFLLLYKSFLVQLHLFTFASIFLINRIELKMH